MDLAVQILAYYTVIAMMVVIGTSIWGVGETREQTRTGAVLHFVALSIVIIFAILVILKG